MFAASNTKGWLFSRALLFLGALLSILWSGYFAVVTISIPYQIELREGAAQVMTDFLLSRTNPFVFEHQPLAMNNYGLGYNLVVTPFAALLGNTLSVHRSVTFVFILLSSLVGFIVVYKTKKEIASSAACAAFIMIGLMGRGGIGAFPSALGTFLFMLTILVPFLKGFDRTSLLLSILFSVAAFHSKAYFVLGFGVVASYLFLFVSKKTGLFYSALFLILVAISFLAARLIFPLYILDTIIANISNTDRSFAHLVAQLAQLWAYFFPVLLSFLFFLIFGKEKVDPAGRAFNIWDLEQPLLRPSLNYLFYSSMCALLAFLLFLGSHIGSYLNYVYQLILPLFFCWVFSEVDLRKKISIPLVIAVLFNLFFWGKDMISPQMLEQRDSREWARLYSYVQSSSNILNSPVITSKMIELGLNPLDSGQTSYFYSVEPYPNNAIFGPSYETFHADGLRYIKFIDNSVEKQKFDLVVTTAEKSTFYHAKLIEKFYVPVDEIKVDMPQTGQQWTVLLWRPLSK